MRIDVPDADVADRVTILELKHEHLPDQREAIERELAQLHEAWLAAAPSPLEALPQLGRLRQVNRALWEVEDALRAHEARQDFGDAFVERARSVYRLNDERARLKRAINDATGSALQEHKSYG